jgi:hypothetical protein
MNDLTNNGRRVGPEYAMVNDDAKTLNCHEFTFRAKNMHFPSCSELIFSSAESSARKESQVLVGLR